MKRGGLLAWSVVLMLLFSLSSFADELTVNMASRVLDSFDDPDASPWIAQGSKFASVVQMENGPVTYPQYGYVETYPEALFRQKPENTTLRVFGIHGKFDRLGYNFVDILPVTKNADGTFAPRPVDIPGRVQNIDLWVWGDNHDYSLQVVLQDYRGVSHVLDFGSIKFGGWKNLKVDVPPYIPQSVNYKPSRRQLKIVKFILWTKPSERVDDFYTYFDQLKVFTDLFESDFDGDDLADPASVEKLWSEAVGTN